MGPSELEYGVILFWIESVTRGVHGRGYGTEEVSGKLQIG
jgi:hypothetical protein